MKIAQRPYKFSFSKNPVQYTFTEISNYADAGCYLLIQIYKRDIGGANESLLYEEQIKPLTSTVVYDMASIVESALEYSMPDFAGTVLQAGNNVKEFYVKFAIITDAAPTPSYSSDAVNFMYAIKGGIPQPQWDWNNYFINYVTGNKPFLTWQPNNRFVGLHDSFFISFLNSLASVSLALIVDVEYIDGTTDQIITNFTDSSKILYHIQAGPDQLGLNALHADKRLYKYSLSIVSAANHATVFVNPYTYYIDYRNFYNTKFLHYYNSLGGIEMVRINGMIETTADVTFTDSERFGGNIIVGSPNSEEYTQTAKSKVDSFKGDSGFLFTKAEQDVFQEILLTRFAWERIIGNNWRIYVTNKSTSLRKTSDKRFSMPLEWRYSFTNSVYAPLIDLGNSCVPVTVSGTLPDVISGVPYSAVLSFFGTSPFSPISAVTKPTWATITQTSTGVTVTGTPTTADEGSATISFTVSNSCGTFPFSDSFTVNNGDIRFGATTFLDNGQPDVNEDEIANLLGTPGVTVTVTLDTLENDNGGTLEVNGVTATQGDTWNVVLDAGGAGSLNVSILGAAGNPATHILGHFTITAVSAGAIGTPDVYQISKVF